MGEAALAAWRLRLGPDRVLNEDQTQAHYAADTTGAKRRMPAALLIKTCDEVQDCVAIAAQHGVAVHPISTGRNWGYGTALAAQDHCVLLDLSGMQRIVAFDRELGVVTLEPGVTQGMLHEYLLREGGEFMVPTTGAGPDCSLVGNALERGYGITPVSDHFAAVTDLQAVRPDGSLYRSTLARLGGEELARLHKWGLGPYEQGLFAQGRAGVVTEMSLVLARRPACVLMGMFSLRDDALLEEAVLRVRTILHTLPGVVGGINLMNQHRVLAMTAPYPAELCNAQGVLPLEHVQRMGRAQGVAPWTGIITLYGTKKVVRAAQQEIRKALKGVGSRLIFASPAFAQGLANAAQWGQKALGAAAVLPARWRSPWAEHLQKLGRSAQALRGALELACGVPNRTAMPLAYWRHPQGMPPLGSGMAPNPAGDGCGLIWYAPLVPMRPSTVRAQVQMVQELLPEHGLEPLITLTSLNERLFDSTVPLLFDARNSNAALRARQAYEVAVARGRELGTYPYRLPVDGMWAAGSGAGLQPGRVADASEQGCEVDPGRYDGGVRG